MNLINEIAGHMAAGMRAAESAARLKAEHGVEVGEDWVRKVMGADGFSAALYEAQERANVAVALEETEELPPAQAIAPGPGPGQVVMAEPVAEKPIELLITPGPGPSPNSDGADSVDGGT